MDDDTEIEIPYVYSKVNGKIKEIIIITDC